MADNRTYDVVYECTNCRTKLFKKIPYKTSIPVLVENAEEKFKEIEAPECEYCGCRDWSHGRKPKLGDYTE